MPKLYDLSPRWAVRDVKRPYDGIRQVAGEPCTTAEYKGSSTWPGVTWRDAEETSVRVPARAFVTELMADSGGLRKALFRWKGDEARNYGFAFIGGRRGTVSPGRVEGEGRLVYWGLCRGYWNICFLPYVSGKPSVKVIDCLIVQKIWEWLYCPFGVLFFSSSFFLLCPLQVMRRLRAARYTRDS